MDIFNEAGLLTATRRNSGALQLSERDIHAWTLPVQGSDDLIMELGALLSPDEKDRAARFHFDRLRRSFITVRGILRCLLGRYTCVDPATIQFAYGPKGKPALAGPASIEFNTSHSGDLAAFAFTAGCSLGVDIELIRPLSDLDSIADRFFCPDEAEELLSLPARARERSFYYCWTRKEAYVKAIGDGLSTPLDQFRVTLKENEPARFVHIADDRDVALEWTLHNLQLAPDYAAALAYRDRPRSISIFPIVL